jgi:hypothetical protein
MRRFVGSALIAGLLLAGASDWVVIAQDSTQPQPSAGVVKTGDYRELNFWRNLKLGTAPYVNPKLLDTAAITFKYEPMAIEKAISAEKLKQAVAAGELVVAERSDDGFKVLSIGLAMKMQDVADWLSNSRAFPTDRYALVSQMQEFQGVKSSGAFVAWDAGDPAAPPKPQNQ